MRWPGRMFGLGRPGPGRNPSASRMIASGTRAGPFFAYSGCGLDTAGFGAPPRPARGVHCDFEGLARARGACRPAYFRRARIGQYGGRRMSSWVERSFCDLIVRPPSAFSALARGGSEPDHEGRPDFHWRAGGGGLSGLFELLAINSQQEVRTDGGDSTRTPETRSILRTTMREAPVVFIIFNLSLIHI